MQYIPTESELKSDEKERALREKAERCSMYEKKEIQKRHKQYKSEAKNLAGLKGATKTALEYELCVLNNRIDEINKELLKR